MDVESLKDDKIVLEKLSKLQESVDKIGHVMEVALNGFDYNSFNAEDKVNYDLFVAYTLSTLYWMYLRTKGVDPNKNDVKNELNRIREYMVKAKVAHDRNTIRPKINQAVAGRFVKHGLSHSDKSDESEAKRRKC